MILCVTKGSKVATVNSGVLNRSANRFSFGEIVPPLVLDADVLYSLTANTNGGRYKLYIPSLEPSTDLNNCRTSPEEELSAEGS